MLDDPEQRVSFLRGYLDFVVARYEEAIRQAEQGRHFAKTRASYQKTVDDGIDLEVESRGSRLEPRPTPRQIRNRAKKLPKSPHLPACIRRMIPPLPGAGSVRPGRARRAI